jgi:hypothetical protein
MLGRLFGRGGDVFRLWPLLHAGSTAGRRATIVLSGLWRARSVAHVEARDAWQVPAEAGCLIRSRRANEKSRRANDQTNAQIS